MHREYDFASYLISENGAGYPDVRDAEGRVNDIERVSYLRRHLEQVVFIIERGIPLQGYFAGSFIDNF